MNKITKLNEVLNKEIAFLSGVIFLLKTESRKELIKLINIRINEIINICKEVKA